MVRVQQKKHAAEPQVQPRSPGLPCAMVLTLIRDLPGDRRSCPRRPWTRRVPRPWYQHRDIRTTRLRRPWCVVRRQVVSSLRHVASIASKPNARDDREAPLSSGRDAGKCELDLPDGARVLFVTTNLPDGATRPRCAQLRESGFTSTH